MKALVIGASGMLGAALTSVLVKEGHSVKEFHGHLSSPHEVSQVGMYETFDVVFNCAGAIPQKNRPMAYAVLVNSALPHWIAATFHEARVIHVSTDCVFRGNRMARPYEFFDQPDAYDVYGMTKRVGEMGLPDNCIVVRTSFVGLEHGLLAWAISKAGTKIDGWKSAMWSGSTVYAVARALAELASRGPSNDARIEHVATMEPISKYDLLCAVNEELGLGLTVTPAEMPYVYRALEPTIGLPPFTDSLAELRDDYHRRLRTSWA